MILVTIKSVCEIAVTFRKIKPLTSSSMNEKNITFEDLPKAMSWMMDKLNELDSKIDGLIVRVFLVSIGCS